MKKVLAMVLSVVLVLGLAACSLAEGAPVHKFAFVSTAFTNEIFAAMLETFETLGEQNGIEVYSGEHNADAATMLEVGENLIAAGVDCLMFQNFDPEGTAEIVEQWEEQGVRVISYDETSATATVNIQAANYDVGYQIGKMAANWINTNLADQERVEVYVHGHFYDYLALRGDGIEAGLTENAPNAVVVDRQDVMGSAEPDTFENSLIAHPDIQVVCTINDTSCVNIVEWWISELEGSGADLSKYAGFSVDAVDTALALIADSRTNDAIFRGTLDGQMGGYMSVTAQKIWDTVMAIYNGEKVEDWYFNFIEVTADNIADYGF